MGHHTHNSEKIRPLQPWGVLVGLCIGIALASWTGWGMGMAVLLFVLALLGVCWIWRRPVAGLWRRAVIWGLLASSVGWMVTCRANARRAPIEAWAAEHAGLVRLRGTLAESPRRWVGEKGPMSAFMPDQQTVDFPLTEVSLLGQAGWFTVDAGIWVRLEQPPAQGQWEALGPGDRIELLGSLHALRSPLNPGTADPAAFLREQGVAARVYADDGATLTLLAHPAPWQPIAWRRWVSARAAAALDRGLEEDAQRAALLRAILLGVRSPGMDELRADFRATGLMHLLVLSGANVAIFLGAIWFLGRWICGRPRWVALGVALILALFLLAVPPETPVLRAGVMALLLTLGAGLGRPLAGTTAIGMAAIVLLVWHPLDLFSAGFQLSFVAVAALIFFVPSITDRVWRRFSGEGTLMVFRPEERPWRSRLARFALESVVAAVVVVLAVWPLLMAWFPEVCPLAALTSLLASPLAALLLWVGYLKIAVGMMSPAVSVVLAWPLERLADGLADLVAWMARWPGTRLTLLGSTHPLTAGLALSLVLAGLAVIVADDFHGRLARWQSRMGTGLTLLSLLLVWGEQGVRRYRAAHDTHLKIHALAVGDGSCFLIRRGQDAWLYDCGSRDLARPGTQVVVPALRALGVRRLRGIVLSHADLDHFGGVLDVAAHMPVDAVVGGPSIAAQAVEFPHGPEQTMLTGLAAAGIPYHSAQAGWQADWGGCRIQALWPAPGAIADSTNNASLALTVDYAGRRAAFFGDLEAHGLSGLLAHGPLRADIAELPHHGGWGECSGAWLDEVRPAIVFQSSSRKRMMEGPGLHWATALRGVTRLATAEGGMCTVRIADNGELQTARWLYDWEDSGR